MNNVENNQRRLNLRDRLIIAGLIGLVTSIISIYISHLAGGDSGDFRYTLWLARDWLSGKEPYLPIKFELDTIMVPYPFTAVLLAIPFSGLTDSIASGIFLGFGSGMLAWLILKDGCNWRLMLFLSWPFVNNLFFAQWAPYVVSLFFTPILLFMVFIKPQLALPFVLTQKPNRIGLMIAAIFLAVSLVLYPLWPIDWIKTTHNYIGYPPILTLPLGPLILLALIRYKEKRSWLLVFLAAMPQRMVYDQLGVLFVAENRKQLLFLVICSWISLPVLLYYNGWANVPWGWQTWIIIASYLPALLVVLFPVLIHFSKAHLDYFDRIRF
jgi:hypothetical protein